MNSKHLILKFENEPREYYFENKVFVIEDKKLIENLKKPNIKNGDSTLIIKSMSNIHISDVVQIKINLADTGCFLASFDKENLDEEKRTKLLEEIGKLKNKKTPTDSVQTEKSIELIKVLNKFRPIYVTLENTGDIKINTTKLSHEELKFPLLVLSLPKSKFVIRFKKTSGKTDKNGKNKSYSTLQLFSIDYFFIFLFSLLGSFGITTAVFEFMNKENIAIFLAILGLAFTIVLAISMQYTIYKKGKEKNPFLRYYLAIFIITGIAAGIVGGYFVSKLVLKTKIENFDYKKMLLFASAISAVAMLSSLVTSILVNLIVKKRIAKKN